MCQCVNMSMIRYSVRLDCPKGCMWICDYKCQSFIVSIYYVPSVYMCQYVNVSFSLCMPRSVNLAVCLY